ncbi:prostatic acid phosphatase-like [Oppia nitens]|uniref:prostatic acid phosphatase-like n=1 Tax=Oppia nitens TaxID=1686743 RepID=UPI0023DA6E41|nr:prostatic acid phosphatase-like [Oppia nitens]
MKTLVVIILFVIIIGLNGISDAKQLKLVFAIFRHGDRTPVATYPTDPYTDESKYWPDGYGQLIQSGKQRMYSLGKYMRKRYKSFLGQSIREVWIRSSQRDRCLNSALLVMAGLYPPTGRWKWGRDLGNVWQPVPVNTVEFAKDSMLNPDSDCPVAKREEYIISKSKDVQNLFKKHKRLVNYIATKTGLKFKDHGTGRDLYNNLQIVQTHNHMLPNWTNSEVMECLKEFHEMSFLFDSSTQLIRKLRAGQLLKDIRYRLKQFIASKEKFKHKLFIYSTHDTQLSVFLRSLDIYNNMSPPYGSTIFIELYDLQTKTSKKKSVFELEVHYLNDTKSEKPYELPVKMCQKANKTICELNNFFSVTKNLIVNNWEQECQESYLSSIFKFEL